MLSRIHLQENPGQFSEVEHGSFSTRSKFIKRTWISRMGVESRGAEGEGEEERRRGEKG